MMNFLSDIGGMIRGSGVEDDLVRFTLKVVSHIFCLERMLYVL